MSPIIHLKSEDKFELIRWKIKNIHKKLCYWDVVMCKWVNFSSERCLSNVEEINLILSFFKNKTKNFDFCYLKANNLIKCRIYEKIAMREGDDEQLQNNYTIITYTHRKFFQRKLLWDLFGKFVVLRSEPNTTKSITWMNDAMPF